MVDARDIAAVAIYSLSEEGHENKTYVLTGPKAVSYSDVAKSLTTNLGREIKYIPTELETSRKGMIESGMPAWLADDLTAINKSYAEDKGSELSGDVEKVTSQKPISLEEFIKDYKYKFE